MTLDENPYAEPDWLRRARREETARDETARLEYEQQNECESVETTERIWDGAWRFMPWHWKHTYYRGGPG